jgi:hypothetical protein
LFEFFELKYITKAPISKQKCKEQQRAAKSSKWQSKYKCALKHETWKEDVLIRKCFNGFSCSIDWWRIGRELDLAIVLLVAVLLIQKAQTVNTTNDIELDNCT